MSNKKIVDLTEVLDRLDNDRDLLIELIGDFVDDYEQKREKLLNLIENKDVVEIKQLAHSLKGSAGNISVKSMYDCFMLMEFLAKNNDLKLILEIMQDIDLQIEELKKFLSEYRVN